ncbi:MAG: LLM class flavin-dependent oxidoreductase [Actinobacteria bacterium]|nr:LLM class flavin-dependent oxidoreductase [Actinomycetota bacterium]
MAPTLSILDLAVVGSGETVASGLAGCVEIARRAEALGYRRVWYAEHHNMASIASSATAVLIAHVAAHTERIRLGSGGIMLPNHSPLTIAEQFGTLEALHPGRIDLGLGRAPGTDQVTVRALRRDPRAAETFPQDVVELQAFLADESRVPGVEATPGKGTRVPLYILGSSLFGAELAGLLGLPFGFASHFAPGALTDAVALYRRTFRPSAQCDAPYVLAGVNVIAADTRAEADDQLAATRRARVKRMFSRGGQSLTDAEADAVLRGPQAAFVDEMIRHTAVGTPDEVATALDAFATFADADELVTVHNATSLAGRLRSVELTAAAVGVA